MKWNEIGADQTILTNFYNSLTSKGSLSWDVSNDLCGQTGITCDSSSPKRVTNMFVLLFLLFFKTKKTNIFWNRNLSGKGLQGTIPGPQFANLAKLKDL